MNEMIFLSYPALFPIFSFLFLSLSFLFLYGWRSLQRKEKRKIKRNKNIGKRELKRAGIGALKGKRIKEREKELRKRDEKAIASEIFPFVIFLSPFSFAARAFFSIYALFIHSDPFFFGHYLTFLLSSHIPLLLFFSFTLFSILFHSFFCATRAQRAKNGKR